MCSIKRKSITLRLENDRFYTGITGLSIEPLKEGVQNNLLRHFYVIFQSQICGFIKSF